jgi:hypothetical protein
MHRTLFGLSLFLPLFLGCAGKNVVAGEEKTKAEQLEAALPSWCGSVCARLRACPESTGCDCSGDTCSCSGVDEGCEAQCPAAFARYTNAGEACAVIGQRVKDCFDAVKCSQLSGSDPCPVTPAERAACPDADQVDDTPPSSTGSNGAGSSDGGSPTTDSYANTNPVSCTDSYGAGGGQPATGSSQVTCEEGRRGCSSGHEYSWICARDSLGQRACSCLVDAHATAGFEPSMDCPDLSAVNAGCGWSLLQ